MQEKALDAVYRFVESCSSLQGFLIFRSFGGGTGSGFAANLIEKLTEQYPKKTKFEFPIYPAPMVWDIYVHTNKKKLQMILCSDNPWFW